MINFAAFEKATNIIKKKSAPVKPAVIRPPAVASAKRGGFIKKNMVVQLHAGERVLNAAQTKALSKALKTKKVKLPKGGRVPKKL